LTVRDLLLGERVEQRSTLAPDELAARIARDIDPWGWPWDPPGQHDVVGSIDGTKFWVRRRMTFWSLRSARPWARGRIIPDGTGSAIVVWWLGDVWLRLVIMAFVAGLVFGLPARYGMEAPEIALIAVILVILVGPVRFARGPVRDFLAEEARVVDAWKPYATHHE
jgi:hypothetical protein